MADFLSAVSTRKIQRSEPLVQDVENLNIAEVSSVNSAGDVLDALKSQPSRKTLDQVLDYLKTEDHTLVRQDPQHANIAFVLVNDTLPNYWRSIQGSTQSDQIEQVSRNPLVLGNLLNRLRTLVVDSREKKQLNEGRNTLEHIEDVLEFLDKILLDANTSCIILHEILTYVEKEAQKTVLWREYIKQTVSGQVLSLAAEAEDVLKKKNISRDASWLADGAKVAAWVGLNIEALITDDEQSDTSSAAVVAFCSKALTLGYTDEIVTSLLATLIRNGQMQSFPALLSRLKPFEQKKYLLATTAFLFKKYFISLQTEDFSAPIQTSKTISGAARLLFVLTKTDTALRTCLVTSLTRSTTPVIVDSLPLRRSIIAALSKDDESIQTLLEDSIKLFGDSIYVKHTPILEQEALAQTLVLSAGYIFRSQPMFLTMMAKSTYHINGMSNRIGASSSRARFLGIVVGTAISKMVDKPDIQLKFELDGDEATEGRWFQRLSETDDKIGAISDLKVEQVRTTLDPRRKATSQKDSKIKPSRMPSNEIQGPRVIEVLSNSEEDEDDDLMTYNKPDSDPEDDGDDPETINRNKPSAPVYIRDLVAGLRDQENYDRHELALSTAAGLIRRKANFGTEVTDHLQELATVLAGLQDNLDLTDFAQQRQQALIAVLLAKPAQMAQWFAHSFFSGDYSLVQRHAMLTTLGIGARELAGLKGQATEDLVPAQASFPSKTLPPHLHKIYAEENSADPIMKISSSMAREMLSPLASQAADQLTGPNILKVRTFSSRMEVEKKRSKPIANELARVVADNFFFPLTGRWWINVRAASDSIYTSTHLLPPFLQTLSIILNASGPNTLALPQMTREYWDLLLSVRGLATKDKNILNAVLFGFLMIIETNENKERLATDQGKELMETQAWVRMVFEGLAAGSEEDEKIRVLAAGVVVRCQEVVDKYQRRLVGDLLDY